MAERRQDGDGRSSILGAAARAWPWLKLVLGVALLVLLGWLVDWPGTWRTLRHSDLSLVLLSAAVLVSALIVSTLKWERLVRFACGRLGFPALLRAYWIGNFLSNYLPSNIGGDVARVLVLRHAAGVVPLAGSVLVERLTGVAALAVDLRRLPSASAGGAVEPQSGALAVGWRDRWSVSCWPLPPAAICCVAVKRCCGGRPGWRAASPPS